MVRNMTLAGVLAMLPVAACTNDADDAALDRKAEQAERAAIEATEKTATEPSDTAEKVAAALGAGAAEFGPAVGEALPISSLLTSEGQPVQLAEMLGTQGGVIVFSRSAEWCPYCQKQMVELKDAQGDIEALGMKLTVITYDPVKELSQFKAKSGIGYEMVSDTESTTIIASNLLNADMPEGTKYFGVPHPATIVLDASGNVQKMRVDTDYKIRPTNADIIAMAREVAG